MRVPQIKSTGIGRRTTVFGGGVPINTVRPAITSADPYPNTVATVSTGTWSGSPTFTYAWELDGVPEVPAKTANTRTIHQDMIGRVLGCKVTATEDGKSSTVLATGEILVEEETNPNWSSVVFQIDQPTTKQATEDSNSAHTLDWHSLPTPAGIIDMSVGAGSYLSAADSADWDWNGGDWSVDMLGVIFTTIPGPGSGYRQLFSRWITATNNRAIKVDRNGSTGKLRVLTSTNGINNDQADSTFTPVQGVSYDIMVQRIDLTGVVAIFVDGVRKMSIQLNDTYNGSTAPMAFGHDANGDNDNGELKVESIRVTKGVALAGSSSTYTHPTAGELPTS
jgi:hypothetical protein